MSTFAMRKIVKTSRECWKSIILIITPILLLPFLIIGAHSQVLIRNYLYYQGLKHCHILLLWSRTLMIFSCLQNIQICHKL